MKQAIRNILERSALYHPLRNCVRKRRQAVELKAWKERGCPVPPPHLFKQQVLKAYAQEYGLRILVETGTYLGDMVEAMKASFDRIFSIELSEPLFEKARKRFANIHHVEIIQGDSGIELGNIVPRIDRPALFWLDGHYSGRGTARGHEDSPIYKELNHILRRAALGHVVIIDDARYFGADPGYPGLDDLKRFVSSVRGDREIVVRDDSIRITPRRPA